MARPAHAEEMAHAREGVSVVIPAHDEEAGIGKVIADLLPYLASSGRDWEIVVIDDGSRDETARRAAAPGVRVIRHEAKLGYGASLKTGIRRARHELIVITDADGTYPAALVPELFEALDEVDMAVAARTGQEVHVPLLRRPAKWCLRKLAEYLAQVELPDLNSGLRCFRKSTIQEYLHLLPNGFSFTTTLTLAYHSDSRLVRYLPTDYRKRTGSSKIRPLADSYNFLLLIFRTVMYFDPMRIFMPPALVALLITIGTLVYEIFWSRNLAEKSLLWLLVSVLLFGLALLGDLIAKQRS